MLAIVLLVQTIRTYIYVSMAMTIQEARRDAPRRVGSLERAARAAGEPLTPEKLEAILQDSMDAWGEQVAWVRILDSDDRLLAAAGAAPTGPTSGRRDAFGQVEESPAGDVLAVRLPFLLRPTFRPRGFRPLEPPGAGGPRGPGPPGGRSRSIEIAVVLDSYSANFAPLRRNLVIGVSAALALMAAVILIGLRFPHYLRGRQIEGQLELARRVQADLLPSSEPVSPAIDFATECISAWEVGGDFCDVFSASEGRTAIVLGDVSGKGVSAALLMALIHGAVHAMRWTDSPEDHEAASRDLNALLCSKTARERFASLFWACFDPKDSVIRYINAGHLPPVLIRRRTDAAFGTFLIERLETGGPVMGLLPESDYRQGQHAVEEGDLLVAFSDGVVEAANSQGVEFGEARLLEAIRESWNNSPHEIRSVILDRLRAFLKNAPIEDDQTLIVVRFKHSAAYPFASELRRIQAVG